VAGSYEYSNESLGSINGWELLQQELLPVSQGLCSVDSVSTDNPFTVVGISIVLFITL
jgi:hypothetical protein